MVKHQEQRGDAENIFGFKVEKKKKKIVRTDAIYCIKYNFGTRPKKN